MIAEPVVTASSAKCSKCPAWVVLQASGTSRVSPTMYEFSCPVEGCGATTRVDSDQAKLFQVPKRWFSRGYFYENELREISDAWTPTSQIPRPRPHGLAVREGFLGSVENAARYPYHVATYDCQCGAGYRIFVDQVHYDLARQFQNYVKDVLEYVHKNGGPHPDVIGMPMDAEFSA